MTVKNAIDTADRRMPGNEYSKSEKVTWLKTLEAIWSEFLFTLGIHNIQVDFTDDNAELTVKEPYDEIYVIWLIMKMHYYNGEIELYNNSAEAFNNMLQEAKKSFMRANKSNTQYSFRGHREV